MGQHLRLGTALAMVTVFAAWMHAGCSKDETQSPAPTGSTTSTTTSSAGGGGASGCPADWPDFGGATTCTDDGLHCDYGEECCCGSCYTSYSCSCTSGVFSCYYTDACYIPGCGGGGAGGTAGAGGGGQGGA